MKQMRAIICCLALVSALLASAGCRSTSKPADAQFAAVDISGQTPARISAITFSVFEANGYLVADTDPKKPIFEKQASGMNNLKWGNWISDTRVWERVRVTITPRLDSMCRVQCQAFVLRDRGSVLEEEIKISGIHSGKYQEMLEDVAKRLSGKAEPAAAPK